jgi:hypothetical protein
MRSLTAAEEEVDPVMMWTQFQTRNNCMRQNVCTSGSAVPEVGMSRADVFGAVIVLL